MITVVGFLLAIVVGISLGLLGSGGSILTLPILVYVLGYDSVEATSYSLFIVGITSLIGGILKQRKDKINYRSLLNFGIPSVLSIFITRTFILPSLPSVFFTIGNTEITKSTALLILFAIVMIFSSLKMIIPCKKCNDDPSVDEKINSYIITILGIIVGIISGLVGAGGGFLIVPSLVLFGKIPIKNAIITSMFIVAINSAIGFLGDLNHLEYIDWKLLSFFSSFALAGLFIGKGISNKISTNHLKKSFGFFVLIMGTYILTKEIIL